jgi:hypothetical protein
VGLALGFAFQDIAANFMSGFIMALNRPFKVGDLVQVAGHRGRIKDIHFRARAIAIEHRTPLADLAQHMGDAAVRDNGLHWWDSIHMSSLGNAVAAEFLRPYLFEIVDELRPVE